MANAGNFFGFDHRPPKIHPLPPSASAARLSTVTLRELQLTPHPPHTTTLCRYDYRESQGAGQMVYIEECIAAYVP